MSGCDIRPTSPARKTSPQQATRIPHKLNTAPASHANSYDHDLFPEADTNHNGCETRDDVLYRQARRVEVERTEGCAHDVIAGVWRDPYTGKRVKIHRPSRPGPGDRHPNRPPRTAGTNAWTSGAWKWNPQRREGYANDPAVLVAVDGPTNAAKGDSGPEECRPQRRGYWCTWIQVKRAYGLTVTAAERHALKRTLSTCRASTRWSPTDHDVAPRLLSVDHCASQVARACPVDHGSHIMRAPMMTRER